LGEHKRTEHLHANKNKSAVVWLGANAGAGTGTVDCGRNQSPTTWCEREDELGGSRLTSFRDRVCGGQLRWWWLAGWAGSTNLAGQECRNALSTTLRATWTGAAKKPSHSLLQRTELEAHPGRLTQKKKKKKKKP
jgi:hypothetical protein